MDGSLAGLHMEIRDMTRTMNPLDVDMEIEAETPAFSQRGEGRAFAPVADRVFTYTAIMVYARIGLSLREGLTFAAAGFESVQFPDERRSVHRAATIRNLLAASETAKPSDSLAAPFIKAGFLLLPEEAALMAMPFERASDPQVLATVMEGVLSVIAGRKSA